MPEHVMTDRYGRLHDDLRVSVTDRCNLRCTYCMPSEPEWYPRSRVLTYEETERLVRIFVALGVRKVRVTGGEPLVRRDVERLVARIRSVAGVADLSLTTNGVLLEAAAEPLARAGLDRVNVSLDTLDRERFRRLTGRDHLARVLRGLDAAERAGLGPIKVNTVLLRGVNDDEIESFVGTARERGWEVRFIEFMPLENGATWDLARVVRGEDVRRRIAARWPIEPDAEADPRAPARRFRFRDGRGALGFIDSVTRPFCGDCGRLRLTADGKLRVCLYDDAETDLRGPLRSGAADEDLVRRIAAAVARKGRGGALDVLERRAVPARARTMHQIGG